MSTDGTTQDGIETWASVARLLCRCADMALVAGRGHSMFTLSALGLGADLLASQAMGLLPAGVDLDHPVPVQTDPVQLLAAAEALTRTHPVVQFPPGASPIIARIRDLSGENPA